MKERLKSVRRGVKAITTLNESSSNLLILVDPTEKFAAFSPDSKP